MKNLILILVAILTFTIACKAQNDKLTILEGIALEEGIDSRALYKYRMANVKLTRKGTKEYPYSFYDVPVMSMHESDIHFKDIGGIRFYKTIPEMYRDVCRFFYSKGDFLIPEHPNSMGGQLKFKPDPKYVLMGNTAYTCNDKGGCKMPDHETSTEKDKKKAIAIFEDKRDLIISYCKLQKQYIPENAGIETVSISSILNTMQDFVDEMKTKHLPDLDRAEASIYP